MTNELLEYKVTLNHFLSYVSDNFLWINKEDSRILCGKQIDQDGRSWESQFDMGTGKMRLRIIKFEKQKYQTSPDIVKKHEGVWSEWFVH